MSRRASRSREATEPTSSIPIVTASDRIRYRRATSADVDAISRCRREDPLAGDADPRLSAYLDGRSHPREALLPRIGFLALDGDRIVGYVAGHLTTRHGCDGEVQHLFVAPSHRRQGIASALLRLQAQWFQTQGAAKVCVDVDVGSAPAIPFYVACGASPLNRYWYVWDDMAAALGCQPPPGNAAS